MRFSTWLPFRRLCRLGSACLFLAGCLPLASQALAEPPAFNPRVVIRRAFPAIEEAPFVSARQADSILHEDELVLGTVVGGKARAYPINMLTGPRREIINDRLGGRPIAATW